MAGLRASLAPGGEVVLESTANGAYGCFYDEWMHAQETGYVRHFFPWWWEPAYVGDAAAVVMDERERRLVQQHGLTGEQIAYRRGLQKQFGRMIRRSIRRMQMTASWRAARVCLMWRRSIDGWRCAWSR